MLVDEKVYVLSQDLGVFKLNHWGQKIMPRTSQFV